MTQFLEFEPELISEPASASVPECAPGTSAPETVACDVTSADGAEAGKDAVGKDGAGKDAAGEPGSGPAALADLVAAGLVSHEMIGDPVRLGARLGAGAEAATLRRLCAHVSGSIWRIEPYHYAFRLEAAAAAGTDPEAAGAALEARLADEFGPDAAWVNATDLIDDAEAGAGEATTTRKPAADMAVDLDAPLLLLRASAGAVADGLDFAGPGVQAVVSASFAARAAHIAAAHIAADRRAADRMAGESAADADLVLRFAALEAGQARIEAALAANRAEADRIEADRIEADPAPDFAGRFTVFEAGQARIEVALAAEAESRAAAAAAEVRLTELLAKVLRRLDAQADVLHSHIAREDQVAARLGEIAALAEGGVTSGATGVAFQETLGLALAEFLARLERREAAMVPARVPQVS
ncbi:hypothetical protein HNP73_004388 [Amaricoccus macauensis]|uniref:Uncharacterized protein n=1 Tax=Amaricoccus macauensis TaxID=57001 RepID=A0A840SUM1_9RHOB|nr:hypothetical protein [Amaricoccus macauensis]MBB5224418.1 hypothetical protein [Amaricoccus macauensis]